MTVFVSVVVAGCSLGSQGEGLDASSTSDVTYSQRHIELADELRTMLAEYPDLFASADTTAFGNLDYLEDVELVLEGTVVELVGPPVEIIEGLTVYDDQPGVIPGALVTDIEVLRNYGDVDFDVSDPVHIKLSSGLAEVGARYQFHVGHPWDDPADLSSIIHIDIAGNKVAPGILRNEGNGVVALSELMVAAKGQGLGKSYAEVLLGFTDEMVDLETEDSKKPLLTALKNARGVSKGFDTEPLTDDYPSLIDPAEAADMGLVPIEVLVLVGSSDTGTYYSLRGHKKDLDSWAQIHEERHYAVITGYVEPGDSVQILSRGSFDSPAKPLALYGVRGNKIDLPIKAGVGGLGVVVDLREEAGDVVTVFDNRDAYIAHLQSFMDLLNVAVEDPDSIDVELEFGPTVGTSTTTTTIGRD